MITEYTECETVSENNIIITLGKIQETALFQNIFGLPTSYDALQSDVQVEISISYFNNSLDQGQYVYFRLYDSKCRECINKETAIRVVKIIYLKYFCLTLFFL